jgi:hypothetical protein
MIGGSFLAVNLDYASFVLENLFGTCQNTKNLRR